METKLNNSAYKMRALNIIIILLNIFTSNGYCQNYSDTSYIDGACLTNLKAADISRYYKYVMDSVNYTLLKFDKNGNVVEHKFHTVSDTQLFLDSTEDNHYKCVFLKNANGQRMYNIIRIGHHDPLSLVIEAYLMNGNNRILYGNTYAYYDNKRMSAMIKYNKNGEQEWEMIKYDAHGYKSFEQIKESSLPKNKIILYERKGVVNTRMGDKKDNFDVKEVHYKNGMVFTVDTLDKQGLNMGTHVAYYDTGALKEKTSYKHGKKDGTSILYDPNGKVSLIENYKEGVLEKEKK